MAKFVHFVVLLIFLIQTYSVRTFRAPDDEETEDFEGLLEDEELAVPKQILEVSYKEATLKKNGCFTSKKWVENAPIKVDWEADPNSFYALVMYDIESTKDGETYLQWLVVNIPGNNVTAGETLAPYKQPRRLYEIFELDRITAALVFGPMEKKDYKDLTFADEGKRRHFEIKGLSKTYNLGNPFAGTTYFSNKLRRPDDYLSLGWQHCE